MRFLPVLIALLVGACHQPPPPQDLVVICIDTLRADHLGLYGYHRNTSPFLGEWAMRGTTFDRAFAPSSWTVPSVASLLTGRYPWAHSAGVHGEVRHLSDSSPPSQIREGVFLATSLLQEQGFATGIFSANPFFYGRLQEGFEDVHVGRVDATAVVDLALNWFSRREPRRRFAYVHLMDLHAPNEPPEPFFSLFAGSGTGSREAEHGEWTEAASRVTDLEDPDFLEWRSHRVAVYDGAISYVDEELNRLLRGLQEMGVLQEALVVITADHGEEFWDHARVERQWDDDPRGIWGVGHGHTLFQEQLWVPLVFFGQGVPLARRSPCPVSLIDVMPTAFGLLGIPGDPSWQGKDLTSFFAAGAGDCRSRPVFSTSTAYGPEGIAVLVGPMKLYRRGQDRVFLFDVDRDRAEKEDLSGSRPELVETLTGMTEGLQRLEAQVEPGVPVVDPELREQLRALGYF